MFARKQVTQYIFRVKEGDSQEKQAPKDVDGTRSDCKKPAVPVQDNSLVSDTTPISNSRIYGEDGVQSDYNKTVPSIKEHSPLSVSPKSK
jgi:hypothetical protein